MVENVNERGKSISDKKCFSSFKLANLPWLSMPKQNIQNILFVFFLDGFCYFGKVASLKYKNFEPFARNRLKIFILKSMLQIVFYVFLLPLADIQYPWSVQIDSPYNVGAQRRTGRPQCSWGIFQIQRCDFFSTLHKSAKKLDQEYKLWRQPIVLSYSLLVGFL